MFQCGYCQSRVNDGQEYCGEKCRRKKLKIAPEPKPSSDFTRIPINYLLAGAFSRAATKRNTARLTEKANAKDSQNNAEEAVQENKEAVQQ